MGDFLLDFRRPDKRKPAADEALRFFPDLEVDRIHNNRFDLVLTRSASANLWAPYRSPDGTIVALAGRIALDPSNWEKAEQALGDGGLACKAIYQAFQANGFAGIQQLNGAYAIHLFEPEIQRYSLILDPAGCYPSYGPSASGEHVYSSHADILAVAIEATGNWDYASLAGFLATGHVSHPYTYYKGVVGLDWGTRYCLDLLPGQCISVSTEKFAAERFQINKDVDEDQLADELAAAVSRTVKQVTQPRLGSTFIALSGGLDSRLIISQADKHEHLRVFCARGVKKNAESRTADALANVIGIEMLPMVRDFDHYADQAEMGVRIGGGMGSISSNHFLGFRDRLRALGCDNLVTGCYFDYLFKTLALDTTASRLLRRDELAEFKISSYLPYIPAIDKYEEIVLDRLHEILPRDLIPYDSEASRLQIAARRTFPLWREGDNIQRLVAHRVFDWYSPAVFHEILDVYWRTPVQARLGKSMFKKVVLRSISPAVQRIPDNNTGLRIDASELMVSVYRYRIALRRLIERNSRQLDTRASWLNWGYYLRKSSKIRTLWCRPNDSARALIEELTGQPFLEDLEPYLATSTGYFLRLLTLKLWAELQS